METTSNAAISLPGIDGGNLLAYLAALGTLRTLSETARVPVQMHWHPSGGTWRPVLSVPESLGSSAIIDLLDKAFAPSRTHPELHPSMQWKHWNGEAADRRNVFKNARDLADSECRSLCDWLSAIGSDLPDRENQASDTPLRASRADYLMGNLQSILATTSAKHLQKALMTSWTYDDPLDNSSLKFDPTEDRRHALQWCAPTKDRDRKKRGNMLGANRLAIEAIPLFTSAIVGSRLGTTSCSRPKGENWQITWPLWHDPIGLDVVRSLLTRDELLSNSPNPIIMQSLGVCAVFRCRRETVGKTRVFTPARRVS